MATTPTQEPIPSEDPRNVKFNAGKIDEEVNGSADYYTDRFGVQRLTNTGRNNQFQDAQTQRESDFVASQADKEARFQQFLLSSGYVFLGDYEGGPFQFSARNQYIRYNNQYYRLNAATGVGFTTTGTTAASFANDVTHFVLMDGDTLRQNMAAGDGLKYIGQCANYAELRTKTPEYDGQKIYVRSSVAGWAALDDAFPSEPMTFVSLSRFKLADFPDDGGTLIAAADGVNVWVNAAILKGSNILVEWFGADNNFTSDSTSVIERALAAAEFWATRPYGSTRGPLAHRWTVVFPQKWTASRTLTYNPVLAELDFDGSTGLFLSDGEYGTHPKDSTVPMCFYLKCEKPTNPGSDLYIPAYNDFPLAKNGSLVFGTLAEGQPSASYIYNVLPTTRHCLFAHNGVSETLYTALGTLEDISISGFGLGYKNGDYAWGVRFVRVKFTNNGAMASLGKYSDNGERFDFVNCMSMNNARGFEFNDWAGQINWHGGSFDYFKQNAPFTWDDGGKAILAITQAHFEFNPYITGCMFDLSAAHENANVSIRDSFMVLAVGADDGGVINNAFIKRKYAHHAVVDNMTIVDVSASGQFTKNYLFFEDQPIPALAYNMNPLTLKDYFVASPFLNRRRIAQWQFYFSGSTDFIPTFTDDSVSVAGSASAVAGQDKSLFIFIPAADVKTNVQFLLGMLTCTRCDINVAFAMWTGYSKSAAPGLVNASDIVIDAPVGAEQLVTLKVGRNSSVTAYAGGEINPGGYTLADWARPVFNKPAEGLIVRIWLYNQGPGDTVTLSANSGLITL